MTSGDDSDDAGSPPCFLHELGPDGTPRPDPVQALEVARWRKAERQRLIDMRLKLTPDYRAAQASAIAADLDRLIPPPGGAVISVYWPIRGEPDLRAWMRSKSESGYRVALPVALALGQPLEFREWRPDCRLVRGLWKIPYPAEGQAVVPNVILAPLVGFAEACYRLGYGGGFFDRTLAAIAGAPLVIGVGYPETAVTTIFPQPHDIAMNRIVTGSSPPVARGA